jgi:hypothetical protein
MNTAIISGCSVKAQREMNLRPFGPHPSRHGDDDGCRPDRVGIGLTMLQFDDIQ